VSRKRREQSTQQIKSKKHLEFERFLADLSTRLVALPPNQVDDAIQHALEQCVDYFKIDRLALLKLLPDRMSFTVISNADASGISPYPLGTIMSVSIAPWVSKKLINGELVSFARPEELPPEADVDRQSFEMFQIRSGTYFPIAAFRSSEYSFGITSRNYDRNCCEDLIPRLRLLGELFVNALERSKAELVLRESEERLSLAASAAGAGLWLLDKDNGLTWATQQLRELFQFGSDEQLSFERLLEAIHSDDREDVKKSVLESLKKREALKLEYRIVRPDGDVRWISSSGNSSSDGPGLPERLMGVSIDVTERRQMEIELRERLEEIERLKLQLEKENLYLREEIKVDKGFESIVGTSNAHDYVLFKVKQVAPTDATVLIQGETGTGKGMVAHAIHEMSARKDRPMVTVDCASLPANLIESELFGREKGAFTGAYARQVGRFEVADGGTIFLDEVGEMPLELQTKLLRVLQEGKFERLGSPRTIKVDVRVISATGRDLKTEVQNKRFREDLFYRINVFPISIPPLRMRREDIPLLVRHFVDKYARKNGRRYDTIPKSTMKFLQSQPWPGNVRELEHVIERAVITSPGPLLQLADWTEIESLQAKEEPLKGLEAMEREHILKVLQETGWKIDGKGGAASLLGLHPSTLRFRLKKLDIKRP
jgi:formate hydrogenlyase transcriptional activator